MNFVNERILIYAYDRFQMLSKERLNHYNWTKSNLHNRLDIST